MFPVCCFCQRTSMAQGPVNRVHNETWTRWCLEFEWFSVCVCVYALEIFLCVHSSLVWNLLVIIFSKNFCLCIHTHIYVCLCIYIYIYMFPAWCFRQRTCLAQGLLKGYLMRPELTVARSTTERREIRNFPYPSVFELTGRQRLIVKRGIRNVGQFLATEVTNPGQNES